LSCKFPSSCVKSRKTFFGCFVYNRTRETKQKRNILFYGLSMLPMCCRRLTATCNVMLCYRSVVICLFFFIIFFSFVLFFVSLCCMKSEREGNYFYALLPWNICRCIGTLFNTQYITLYLCFMVIKISFIIWFEYRIFVG